MNTSCAPSWPGSPYRRPRTVPLMPFHPAPYVPSAKTPRLSTPHSPHTPCTLTAPHGSSTFATWSKNHTPTQTRTPATDPIRTAAQGATKAHGAVMATHPASIPLHAIEMSGLPYRRCVYSMAAAAPKHAARMVFTATTLIRRSVAPRVDPGLNPIHPNSRMNVPITTYPRLWPGMAFGVPSLPNLPMRGPRMMARARAAAPPVAWTTPLPAKSTAPCPRWNVCPRWASHPPPHTQFPITG